MVLICKYFDQFLHACIISNSQKNIWCDMYILYEYYLVGELSPSLQKIRLIFISMLVLKTVRFQKEFWSLSKLLKLNFIYIKEFAFLENFAHIFLANFNQVFYVFLSPRFKTLNPKIHYFDILQLHMHILSYSTHACVSVPLSCDMVSLYWFCFKSKQNWEP